MGLGFGKKTPDEYKQLESMGDDLLPPATYVLVFDSWRHWANPNASKPSTYFLGLKTTGDNECGEGKSVSMTFNYHPDPASVAEKNYTQMNAITEANIKDWIEAANSEPVVNEGAIDLIATMEMLAGQVKPKVVVPLTQDTYNSKTRNAFGKPKALGA